MLPRFNPERFVVGTGLMALGTLGLLSKLGWFDFLTVVRTWWPSIFMVWGAAELYNTFAERAERRTR